MWGRAAASRDGVGACVQLKRPPTRTTYSYPSIRPCKTALSLDMDVMTACHFCRALGGTPQRYPKWADLDLQQRPSPFYRVSGG